MSEESESTENVQPIGSIDEATNRLKALREPAQEEHSEEIQSEVVDENAEQQEEENEAEENQEIEQEVEQEVENASSDTENEINLDAEQFAELLKLDNDSLIVNDDGDIKFKTKVDGELGEATLTDLIKSYQNEASQTKKSMHIAEMKKQQEQIFEQSSTYAEQQAQYAAVMLESLNNSFLNDVSQSNLDQLRIDDPAEYSAKQIEFSQRKQQIQEMAQQSLNILQEQKQNSELEKQRLYNERIPVEAQAMRESFKAMKVDVNEKLQGDISNYLAQQSFSGDEINNMVDHRMMLLAYKASQYDKGLRNVTKKLVGKKLPKVLKSGQKPSAKAVDQSRLNKATFKAKQTGSVDDAVARLKLKRGN